MNVSEGAKVRRYYETLGLRPGAAQSEVKKSARALFLKYHPDLNPDNRAHCEEKTKTIVEAYSAVLKLKPPEPEEAGGTKREAAAPDTMEVLAFNISNRTLALPTDCVREIVRVKDGLLDNIGIVSDAFPYVAGVFRRGNEVTMLWNLHSQLGLREIAISSKFEKNKVIVVEIDDSAVSFIVDGVEGIIPLNRKSLLSPGEGFEVEGAYLDGVLTTGDRSIGLLNLRNILFSSS